jgi:hypothetical protein
LKAKRRSRKAEESLEPEEPSDPSSNGDAHNASASATPVTPQPHRTIDENGEERGPYHRYSAFLLHSFGNLMVINEIGVMASSSL